MSVKMKKIFSREMQNLDAAGLLRTETAVVQYDDMTIQLAGGKSYLNFIGNDILGWSENDKIREAAEDALASHGTGSTSSRNSIGTISIIKTLEEKLAGFLGFDDCIVFSSHYFVNIGLLEPLTNQRDTIFIDEMCNPGLFDGARLSSADVVTYKHKDYDDLEYHLKCSRNSRFRIVVTDGVFSIDGSFANLERIQSLTKDYDAISIVDDSCGVGVLGENGKGTYNHLKIANRPELMTGTFSRALGNVSGGFVCGDRDLINWVRHTSRPYILSEPLSPINTAIALKVIEILENNQPELNLHESVLEKLYSNSEYIKNEIKNKNFRLVNNDYPFVSINVGSTLNAQKIVEHLFEKNILVSALCYPNTPEGASLLRIDLSASHTEAQLDQLINSIDQVLTRLKLNSK